MTKDFWKAAAIRAIKTVCQTAIATIGTGAAGIMDVNWVAVLSASLLAGVVSMLTSIATGLPEAAPMGDDEVYAMGAGEEEEEGDEDE